uniref:Uncharacterized protein n=1 Tax=Romanomermis culicivorax TaxID=13658 RepID=A0A915KP22_ROMCU
MIVYDFVQIVKVPGSLDRKNRPTYLWANLCLKGTISKPTGKLTCNIFWSVKAATFSHVSAFGRLQQGFFRAYSKRIETFHPVAQRPINLIQTPSIQFGVDVEFGLDGVHFVDDAFFGKQGVDEKIFKTHLQENGKNL